MGGLGTLFEGLSPQKPPHGDGTAPVSLKLPTMLLCKGTCAPVTPPLFKGQGGSAPVKHRRSGVLVNDT